MNEQKEKEWRIVKNACIWKSCVSVQTRTQSSEWESIWTRLVRNTIHVYMKDKLSFQASELFLSYYSMYSMCVSLNVSL